MHRHAAGQLGDRLIADKAGLRDDDLVPRGDQRADGHVDGFAAADRDKDVVDLIERSNRRARYWADLRAQLLEPGVGRVLVRPCSRLRMPASRMLHGVLKSGSPTPSEMQWGISAARSKNLRMPDGRISWAAGASSLS